MTSQKVKQKNKKMENWTRKKNPGNRINLRDSKSE